MEEKSGQPSIERAQYRWRTLADRIKSLNVVGLWPLVYAPFGLR